MGWWKYAGRREFFGYHFLFHATYVSFGSVHRDDHGHDDARFSFAGLSIVLVLVLLRGGTLIIAPVVDHIAGRRVRWFTWTAMS